MQTSFYFWGIFKTLAVVYYLLRTATGELVVDSFHTVRTHQQQRGKQIHTYLLDKKLPSFFDATRNAASLSTKKIHVELSSTKICQLLLPRRKAMSMPIGRKQLFPKNREGLDCLEFLNWEQQQLESANTHTHTRTHAHTHTLAANAYAGVMT